jgi:DNA-binding LacI/PurR family transcriptional regulator
MEELGYQYKEANKKPKTIGVVFMRRFADAYENPIFLENIRGISYICNKRCYKLEVITGADYSEILKSMEISAADGYIFLYANIDERTQKYLFEKSTPFIIIGKPVDENFFTLSVDTDNVQAGHEAVSYLLKMGHERIGFIGTEQKIQYSIDRQAGYMQALSEAGIPIREDYMLNISSSYSYNPTNILEVLKKEDHPTAFVVCDDIYAVILVRLIKESGYHCPDDISIVSFNNSIFARLTHPELTSFDINLQQLGMEAVSQLINHIENPNMFTTRTLVPHTLVKRKSVKHLIKTEENGNAE